MVAAQEGAKGTRDADGAVRALVVLEQGDQRAGDGDGGAVEGVDDLVALAVLAAEAGSQPARLEVRAVGCTGDLPIGPAFTSPREPGFDVELAIGGSAQVARRHVDHSVRDLQRLEDVLLDVQELVVDLLGVFGTREGEHLDFGELVDAVEPAAFPAVGASLGSEAVGESRELEGQGVLVEDLVRVHAA